MFAPPSIVFECNLTAAFQKLVFKEKKNLHDSVPRSGVRPLFCAKVPRAMLIRPSGLLSVQIMPLFKNDGWNV